MSRELWNSVINGIDEKIAQETGVYFARHGSDKIPEDIEIDGGVPIQIRLQPEKRSPRKTVGIICACAAAAALMVTGGIFWLRSNPQLPVSSDSTPASATCESGESAESGDIPENIVIVETYEPIIDETSYIDEISVSEFEERQLHANGRVSLTEFEAPDLLNITEDGRVRAPDYTLSDGKQWYGLYKYGGDGDTAEELRVYVSGSSGGTLFGEFRFSGDEFRIVDTVLTDDYIVLYRYKTLAKQYDFALMSRETGEVTSDPSLSAHAADKEYRPLGGISHNGGNTVSWYRRDSSITSYDIKSHDTLGLKNPNMLQYGHSDPECYFTMNGGYVLLNHDRISGGYITLSEKGDGYTPTMLAYEDGIAVWVTTSNPYSVYACDTETGKIYMAYRASNQEYDIGVKEGMLYIRSSRELVLADLRNEIRYVYSYNIPADIWYTPEVYTGSRQSELDFISEISGGAMEFEEEYKQQILDKADSVMEMEAVRNGDICLSLSAEDVYLVPAQRGYFWIKQYRREPDKRAVYHEIYCQDINGFRLLRVFSGEEMLDLSASMALSDGEYLYYCKGKGELERISADGKTESLCSARVPLPEDAAFPEETYANIITDGRGGSEMSGTEERLTVTLEYTYRRDDDRDPVRRDTYIINRDTLEVLTSDKGEFGFEREREYHEGEWDVFTLYDGDDPVLTAFAETLSEPMQKRQDDYHAGIMASDMEDLKETVRDGALRYIVDNVMRVQAGEGWFWMKSYMLDMETHSTYHELYYQEGGSFTMLCEIQDTSLYLACDGEKVFYMSSDGIIECIQKDGTIAQIADMRTPAPDDAQTDIAYTHVVYRTTFEGKDDRLTAIIKKGYSSKTIDAWAYATDICIIDSVDMCVISASKGKYSGVSADGTLAVGEDISNPMGVEYWYSGAAGEHGHLDIRRDETEEDEELYRLGAERMGAASDIFRVLASAVCLDIGVTCEKDGKTLYALNEEHFELGYQELIDLCGDTFAPGVFLIGSRTGLTDDDTPNFGGAYADEIPEEFTWIDAEAAAEYKNGPTILMELINSMHRQDGRVFLESKPVSSPHYSTGIIGIIDSSDTEISYLLCTYRVNDWTDRSSVEYEHSVMTLERINGEWLITEIRADLGFEGYGCPAHSEENIGIITADLGEQG